MPYVGIVYFYRLSFQHLGLSEESWGFRSVLEGPFLDFWCLTFSGGSSEVASNFDLDFRARWWVTLSDIIVILCSCCWVTDNLTDCMSEFMLALPCPVVPCFLWRVSKVFRRTASRLREMPWKVFYLTSVSVVPKRRKCSNIYPYFFSNRLYY